MILLYSVFGKYPLENICYRKDSRIVFIMSSVEQCGRMQNQVGVYRGMKNRLLFNAKIWRSNRKCQPAVDSISNPQTMLTGLSFIRIQSTVFIQCFTNCFKHIALIGAYRATQSHNLQHTQEAVATRRPQDISRYTERPLNIFEITRFSQMKQGDDL